MTETAAAAPASVHGLADEDLPALYRATDRQSLKAQRGYVRATAANLGLATAAAVFGALTLEAGAVDWAAALAAAAFVGAIVVSLWMLETKPERRWYDGRAAAESVKTLAWQYAVGGGDFQVDAESERSADERLLRAFRDIVKGLRGLAPVPVGGDAQITDAMRALRRTALDVRKDAYIRGRILDQLAWYARKAGFNERRHRLWSSIAILFQVLGFLGALFKALAPDKVDVDLLGIAAAAAVAVVAWGRSKSYAELAEAYAVTAQELATIRDDVSAVPRETDNEWARFVKDAEEAMSREHTLWRARRSDEPHRPGL